jgi:pyruvate carboxylase subunit A
VFIGPPSDVLKVTGEKLEARRLMRDSGVRITPGAVTSIREDSEAMELGESIGYPVMIKASGGGGGIGMAIVWEGKEMEKNLKAARSVSQSSFGSDEVFIEKYLEGARHIEFQILADKKGNVVHLGERECSIQRRYQKLIEEAPSPALNDEIRERMGEEAVKSASASGYRNAGTIEFLFAGDDFYFNEINARLQVEHPITEIITGVDLVASQLRIAAGLDLDIGQENLAPRGWAFECRINAEDPYKNFMPSPGLISGLELPGGPGTRVDIGVYEGYTVPSAFDPLITKLITWGEDRNRAIARMRRALSELHVMGIRTNKPFHLKVLKDEDFIAGSISIDFLERKNVVGELETEGASMAEKELRKVAAVSAWLKSYPSQIEKIRSARIKKKEIPQEPAKVSKWARAGREELFEGRSRFYEA